VLNFNAKVLNFKALVLNFKALVLSFKVLVLNFNEPTLNKKYLKMVGVDRIILVDFLAEERDWISDE